MRIELTAAEAECLAELLDVAHRDKIHELHRTATRAYAAMLRGRIELIESLQTKIEAGRDAGLAAGGGARR